MPEELAQARRNLGVVSSTGHPTRAMVPTRLLATRLLASVTRLLARRVASSVELASSSVVLSVTELAGSAASRTLDLALALRAVNEVGLSLMMP